MDFRKTHQKCLWHFDKQIFPEIAVCSFWKPPHFFRKIHFYCIYELQLFKILVDFKKYWRKNLFHQNKEFSLQIQPKMQVFPLICEKSQIFFLNIDCFYTKVLFHKIIEAPSSPRKVPSASFEAFSKSRHWSLSPPFCPSSSLQHL